MAIELCYPRKCSLRHLVRVFPCIAPEQLWISFILYGCLTDGGLCVAVVVRVAREALADAGLTVAHSTVGALRHVLVGLGQLGIDGHLLWGTSADRSVVHGSLR